MTITEDRTGVYDHQAIEARWQARWLAEGTFAARDDRSLPKSYILDMFPYPSGAGLHVGHPLSYTATDILSRFRRHRGFNVLHPMGWDAFGLPAEQYAVEHGVHPAATTAKNIDNFRRQLQSLGFSYDWSREVATTDPEYYRWTQWIFLKLFERGLAYEAEVPVNWCPALGTVLANEEVIDGKSERGAHPVVRRPMRQWMLRITEYADRLLDGLDDLDWPEHIKTLQRNWIGRSFGAEIDFPIEVDPGAVGGTAAALTVFTTRPDTLFGATYMVIAPEHPAYAQIVTDEQRAACDAYRDSAAAKSEMERTALSKDKTGVFTGRHVIHPVHGRPVPIWIADYVMMGYGTGAIMAVPGHDERDHEFATAFGLPIVEVVSGGDVSTEAWTGAGVLVNSDFLDGLAVEDAKRAMIDWLEEHGRGKAAVHTKLRDWLFSRQRYWGEPIPVLHKPDGTVVPVPEDELPITLPDVERYEPSGTGESPLATIEDWLEVTDPSTGETLRRETNTMPQWAGSCWYYLRFVDPTNDTAFLDPELAAYWLPVDVYIGGAEHATLHLLYARFWHKVLFDCGLLPVDEPFSKLVCQGMILGEDHEKMSKSRGNVVNPDDMVSDYGADAFRLYEMFMGPLTATKPWQTSGMAGTLRFLKRVWRLYVGQDGGSAVSDAPASDEVLRAYHVCLDRVTRDVDAMAFNTAISAMMELVNVLTRDVGGMPREFARDFLLVLEPFAPHIAEELHAVALSGDGMLAWASWPAVDAAQLVTSEVEVPVQVNGKVRARITVPADMDAASLEQAARAEPGVARLLEGQTVRKVVAVPGKIVNFVATK